MSENTYIIDPNGAESARLVDQEHLFTSAMGGFFPVEIEPSRIHRVLNLGCGPGEWDTEVAFQYPHMKVVGVDISEMMVKYACSVGAVRRLENARFEVMDVKEPLAFPDSSFDLVNGRLLFGFMDRQSWPKLLKECMRVLRPGGMICLCEYEVTISNSIALQHLLRCLYKALADQERTYSVDRRSIGICPMLDRLLKDAGFTDIAARAFSIDSSAEKPHAYAGRKDTELAFILVKPYLVKAGVIDEAEFEALWHQMQIDMLDEYFVSVSFGLRVWGYKSTSTNPPT